MCNKKAGENIEYSRLTMNMNTYAILNCYFAPNFSHFYGFFNWKVCTLSKKNYFLYIFFTTHFKVFFVFFDSNKKEFLFKEAKEEKKIVCWRWLLIGVSLSRIFCVTDGQLNTYTHIHHNMELLEWIFYSIIQIIDSLLNRSI